MPDQERRTDIRLGAATIAWDVTKTLWTSSGEKVRSLQGEVAPNHSECDNGDVSQIDYYATARRQARLLCGCSLALAKADGGSAHKREL